MPPPPQLQQLMDNVPHEDNVTKILEDLAEKPYPPRRKDLSFYLVLLFAVIPVWSAVPVSWAFVVYALRSGQIWSFAWRGRLSFAVALCEVRFLHIRHQALLDCITETCCAYQVFFSVYHYRLARYISALSPNGHGNLTELRAALKRVLQAGLAFLPEDGPDEEEGNRPGSPAEVITQLDKNDPRAIDFRNYIRTWSDSLVSRSPSPRLVLILL